MNVVVRQLGEGQCLEFDVVVREGHASPDAFVRAVFAFLLEREPKESILGRFDVTVVRRYFPEFDAEIGRYLEK